MPDPTLLSSIHPAPRVSSPTTQSKSILPRTSAHRFAHNRPSSVQNRPESNIIEQPPLNNAEIPEPPNARSPVCYRRSVHRTPRKKTLKT